MIAFAILTAAFIPTIYIYSKGKAFNGYVGASYLTKYSLGNLGQSEPTCVHQYLGLKFSQTFSCPNKGSITNLKYVGLIPSTSPLVVDALGTTNKDSIETSEFELNHCGDYKKHTPIKECTDKFMDLPTIHKSWNETCMGKTICDFNLLTGISGLDQNSADKCL